MTNSTYTAFANLAANGNTATVATPADVCNVGAFMGTGVTFGAGTLKAQVSFDAGTTWLDVPSGSFTAATANTKKQDQTVIGPLMRWNLAGATSPSLDLRQAAREVRKAKTLRFDFAADGNSQFVISRTDVDMAWAAQGTFGGGTVTFEVSPDGGTTWFLVGTGLTANGLAHILANSNPDVLARVKLNGSTSPTVTVFVVLPQ